VAPMTATVRGWNMGASGLGGHEDAMDSWPHCSGAVPGSDGIACTRLLLVVSNYFLGQNQPTSRKKRRM
jgi:hypothetical protein